MEPVAPEFGEMFRILLQNLCPSHILNAAPIRIDPDGVRFRVRWDKFPSNLSIAVSFLPLCYLAALPAKVSHPFGYLYGHLGVEGVVGDQDQADLFL